MSKSTIALTPALTVFFSVAAFLGVLFFSLTSNQQSKTTNEQACTNEAKICPNGSAVGRTGPNCAFAECPADDLAPGDTSATSSNTNATATATSQSYGLWFPFSDEQTINNPRPIIYGKVSQRNATYLETDFTQLEWFGRDFHGAKTLRYKEGEVRNLEITLDGAVMTDVFGFPQFPLIACYRNEESPSGGIEPKLFATESECRQEFQDKLPALIFVFRPNEDLAPGIHTLIVGNETMTFTYDPAATIEVQKTQPLVPDRQSEYLDSFENCPPGYYQAANDFPLPLPKLQNTKVFYGLSFPQSDDEKGSIKRRQASLLFNGQRYLVFLPDSTTYFEGVTTGNGPGRGDFGLFLPADKFVYSDGSIAKPWAQHGYPDVPDMVSGYYSEYYPVDISGREYRGRSLPWAMSNSSGCDG